MGRSLNLRPTPIAGLMVVESVPKIDERGSFRRLYCTDELSDLLEGRVVVQVNQSSTRIAGTVRGLHYQVPPHAEMKVVRCLRGRVWDVAVDLRAASPTFLRWHAEELSPENGRAFMIPEGFAHGFQTLTPDCDMLYLHTAAYVSVSEAGVHCEDSRLAVRWPLPINELSVRDQHLPTLSDNFEGCSL